ncbi:3-methyl-2-oxobutanoate hydroxymethyltransferase [bacterium]|nr:3-methyl-2-oxobutanoate hydroxymethyltransferase [bacterium]
MTTPSNSPVTTHTLRQMKREQRRITMATAYDAITAAWVEAAGIDTILVGDSLTNTALGQPDTIGATLDMMIHHCAAVALGAGRALTIGDMPFMTYKISAEQAMASAARMMQEGRMKAVKLEGGREVAPIVARMVDAGIPVLGHIGLVPQSYHALGGYRIQGRGETDAKRLMNDAIALEDAGAFGIVLEKMPAQLSEEITKHLAIPTISIGAGPGCDGQVLVLADLLGMTGMPPFKFVKQYANLREVAVGALRQYAEDVRGGAFPGPEHSYDA